MMRAFLVGLSSLMLLGCQSGEEPIRGGRQGLEPATYTARPPAPPAEPVEAPRPETFADSDTVVEEVAEEEEERDLSEELKIALGMPTDCVRDFESSRPTTIRVSVTATVRPSGIIITPLAYGSGLSAAARDCIQRRAANIALRPLDDVVSETVSTVLEMDYTPPVVVEAAPGTPEPTLRNVREPLPKRPEVAPSGREINRFPTDRWISGGFDGGRPIQEPSSRRLKGPKPRAIDGYEVDENAQDWR